MTREPRWRRYLRFWRRDAVADVEDELRFHFEERIGQFEEAGLARDEAVRAARERFGDVDAVRSELVSIDRRIGRRYDVWSWLDALRQDARQVVRSLRRQPGLVATVVVTLALAVGANAAVFSVTDALLFRPPAGVVRPASLYRLYSVHPHVAAAWRSGNPMFDYPAYRAIHDALRGVAPVAVDLIRDSAEVVHGSRTDLTGISYATSELIPMLGVRLERGRTFDEHDDDVNTPSNVAVVSHRFAERALGGVDGAVGQRIRVLDVQYQVVGVLAEGFDGDHLSETSVWMPLSTRPRFDRGDPTPWYERRDYFLGLMLRVPPGADARAVAARASVAYERALQVEAPRSDFARDARIILGSILPNRGPETPGKDVLIATRFAGVALLLLVIACANIANLLLARGISRRREIGVRVALGISRSRLAMQILLEAIVLATGAGTVALVVSYWTATVLRTELLPRVRWTYAPVDARVLVFTLAVTFFAATIAGAAPAIVATRFGVDDALKTGARDTGARRGLLRASLLAVQSALCVVLLIGAMLFWRSLSKVRNIDIGFDTERLVVASAFYPDRLRHPEAKNLLPEVARRMREMPGVDGAVATVGGPQSSIFGARVYLATADSAHPLEHGLNFTGVDVDYFRVTGTRILEGRGFTPADRRGAPPVIIVSKGIAESVWPHQRAIGQCLKAYRPSQPCYTVVGIAEDVHEFQRVDPEPETQYYYPLDQFPDTNVAPNTILVRVGAASPAFVAEVLGRELRRTVPSAEVRSQSLQQSFEPELRPWKLGARLFAMLSGLALLVAIIGIYGVVAFEVRQRTREIGVRIALGAQRFDVVGLLVKQGALVVTIGIVAGVATAYYAARFVASLLYGVSGTDPISIGASAVLLLVVAVIASAIPALRANRIDPVIVLRDE